MTRYDNITQLERTKNNEQKWKTDYSHLLDIATETANRPATFEKKTISVVELFEKFFDRNMVDTLVEQSNMYCVQQGYNEHLSKESILIAVGYHSLPHLYWQQQEDVDIPFVKSHLQRTDIDNFFKCLHCANNMEINPADRYYKI